jgi:hypothetical protein
LQKKLNLSNFYENIFICLHKEILYEQIDQNKESKNSNLQIIIYSSKILLKNFVNYLTMSFNIISERKYKSNFFERKKIIENFKIFFILAKYNPVIFSQKAYNHSYDYSSKRNSNFKILMEMIVDILLDIDVKILKEIFYYNLNKGDKDKYNKKFKQINNNLIEEKITLNNNNINIDKDKNDHNSEDKIQLNKKRSIFFYMDLIYKFQTSDLDERLKYFSELFDASKKCDKDLESMLIQSTKFTFPSYTLFFLTKFVMIYIFYKDEKKNYEKLYSKDNRFTFGGKYGNIDESNINEYYINKLKNVEYFIEILIEDMKIIIEKYEKMLNLFSLQSDRTKNLNQTVQSKNIENNEPKGN